MSSLVDVVNDALSQIGETPIAGLDDASIKAQICNTHVPIVLRAMLFDTKWNFAYVRVILAPDTTTPISAFPYQYTLPGDYVRVWGIGDDPRLNGQPDFSLDWKIEQGKLLCGIAGPLTVHYTAYIDEPNRWSGGFTIAFATLLASRLAGAIPHDTALSQAKLQEYYNMHLPNALAGDGQEQSTDAYETPDLLEVRDGNMFYSSYGGTGSIVSSGSGSSGGGTTPSIIPTGWFDVTKYGAQGDGNTDDTAAIQAAIDAAGVAGGRVFLPRGTYKTTSALVNTYSNVPIVGDGIGITTLKPTGTLTPFQAIEITGTGITGSYGPITAHFYLGLKTVSLTTVGDFAAGELFYLSSYVVVPPSQTSACTLISEVSSVGAAALTLEMPAPISFLTSESIALGKWTPVMRSGVSNMTIDMTAATGVVTRAVVSSDARDCLFENLEIESANESAFQTWRGYRNVYRNIKLRKSGSPNESDFQIRDETLSYFQNIQSTNAKGFGPQWIGCSYCQIDGVMGFGAGGRGIKFHGCLGCAASNLTSGNSASTGIAVSLRTQRCMFSNLVTLGNIGGSASNDVGLWFSGQSNIGNRVFGLTTYNNTTVDVAFFDTDTDNLVSGVWSSGLAGKFWNTGDNTNVVMYANNSGFHGLYTGNDDDHGELSSGFLKHSNTPAAADFLGRFDWRGRSSTGVERVYAQLSGVINDPTNAAENGRLDLNIVEAGTVVNHAVFQTPADGEVGLMIRRNVGGSLTLEQVTLGAGDSGGNGYKLLRVPN